MPYISEDKRYIYLELINQLAKKIRLEEGAGNTIDGHVNFIISKLLDKVYTPKYFNYNRAMGVLESVKQEFYRRKIAPYENKKIEENGDIFTTED